MPRPSTTAEIVRRAATLQEVAAKLERCIREVQDQQRLSAEDAR